MVPPRLVSIHGKRKTTSQLKTQLVSTATDIPTPRARFGKISETSVQNTGPMQPVKKLRKRNIRIKTRMPFISGAENATDSNTMETAIPAEPIRYNFFRPMRSINITATQVKTKFTIPIPMV